MFHSRARNATAAARPVKISGVARVSVSKSAKANRRALDDQAEDLRRDRRRSTSRAGPRTAGWRQRRRSGAASHQRPAALLPRGSSRMAGALRETMPGHHQARVAAIVTAARAIGADSWPRYMTAMRSVSVSSSSRSSEISRMPSRPPCAQPAAAHAHSRPRRHRGRASADWPGSAAAPATATRPRISFCMLPPDSSRTGAAGAGQRTS